MYRNFPKPQNSLKRAQELVQHQNYEEALEVLQEVVKGKKASRLWQKEVHEPIMQLYLQVCVRLKKSQLAKEGLYQYKALCQTVNIKSLEDVVREYLNMAKEYTEAAKAESTQTVLDIDDLESINSPESVLMSAVSSEDTQDRTNRMILMPWLRFLWESYRHCMDVFKNHNKLERLYHDIAREAFGFCKEYDRKTEFRRLCDHLRHHLSQVQKYHPNVTTVIDLTNEETLDYHTKTRLAQLDTAIAMDLWQEAFKAIDDFHNLLSYYKKPPRPQTIVDYYNKFGLVCFQSNNLLYHAAALSRVYVITRECKKSFTSEELTNLSNAVLLSTLIIPIESQESWLTRYLDMMSFFQENQRRLCAVLNLPAPPTRKQLLLDLEKYGVMQHASPALLDLYKNLETSFDPLKLHDRVMKAVNDIMEGGQSELQQYVPLIRPVMVVRLLKQISEIYKAIKIERLEKILPSLDRATLIELCLRTARNGEVQLSVDERGGCIVFGSSLTLAQDAGVGVGAAAEGSVLQPMPSEVMRDQVNLVAATLEKSVKLLFADKIQEQQTELRMRVTSLYLSQMKKEHAKLLERPERIEKRLEDIETMCRQKEEEQIREQQKKDEELKAEEEMRLAREAQIREEQRKRDELRRLDTARKKEHLEGFRKKGQDILQDIADEELEQMDTTELLNRRKEELMKEQKERMEKMRKEERKIDYTERGLRELEMPLIEAWAAEQKNLRKEQWDLAEQKKVNMAIDEQTKRAQIREKCMLMVADKEAFVANLKESRKAQLAERLAQWEALVESERTKRLEQRRQKRKSERRARHYAQLKREEEEKAEAEEQAKREAAEKERLARQAEDEKRAEDERRIREKELAESRRAESALSPKADLRGSEFSRREPLREQGNIRAYSPPRRGMDSGDKYVPPIRGGDRDRDRDMRSPPREEFRRRDAAADEFRRGEAVPPAPRGVDDRGVYRPPPREERDRFRDRDDDIRGRGGMGESRGRFDDDARRPPPRDDDFRRRDDDRRPPPPRDDFRRGGGDDDFRRGGGMRDEPRGPPRDEPRGGRFDDDRRGFRDPPRDFERRPPADDFRRGGPSSDLRGGDDRRPPPRRDDVDDRRGAARATDSYASRMPDSGRGLRGSELSRGSDRAVDGPSTGGSRFSGGGGIRRGEDVGGGSAPIRPFRAKDDRKPERDGDDGWTEVRKR